mgnify:CR=1 FL=1
MPVFLKRKPANFLGVRGETPGSPFAFFWGSGQKKVAAHLISFFIASRSFCADIPKSRFFKSGLRATFFLHTKKEGKDVPRGSPLGAPGDQPVFFLGKPAIALPPESAYIQKGPAAPGVRGEPSGALLSSFGARAKRRRPRIRYLYYSIAFFLRGQAVFAHIMRLCHKAQSVLWHPLSFRKERGERSVRGLYPLNPQVACRLSFQESRREGGYPNPPIYKKGAAAPYKYSADSGNRGMSTYDV